MYYSGVARIASPRVPYGYSWCVYTPNSVIERKVVYPVPSLSWLVGLIIDVRFFTCRTYATVNAYYTKSCDRTTLWHISSFFLVFLSRVIVSLNNSENEWPPDDDHYIISPATVWGPVTSTPLLFSYSEPFDWLTTLSVFTFSWRLHFFVSWHELQLNC